MAANVEQGTDLMADEFLSKWVMPNEYYHNMVNHEETYLAGRQPSHQRN